MGVWLRLVSIAVLQPMVEIFGRLLPRAASPHLFGLIDPSEDPVGVAVREGTGAGA